MRHYSRLFATIRTIRDYSLFGIRDCSLVAIRVFQTPSPDGARRRYGAESLQVHSLKSAHPWKEKADSGKQ